MKLLKRNDIVKSARKFLGNPWQFGGRNPNGGIDCGGLVIAVIEDLGIQDLMVGYNPPTNKIMLNSTHDNPKSLYALFCKAYIEIPGEEAGEGDIELYYLRDRNVSCHCAILTDKGFIHTHEGVGKVVETTRCRFWNKRRKAAFRFVGVED
jgi:cell wall-associated NlpC family hydrolase